MRIEDPAILFEEQTRKIRVRINILKSDFLVATHPQVKAIIYKELNALTDDYIERMFALKRGTEVIQENGGVNNGDN